MLSGTNIVKIDEKGRIVIPCKFREFLTQDENKFALTGHPDGFLIFMFEKNYVKLEEKVRKQPDSDSRAMYYKQTLIGMAEVDISLNKLGRISLSPELRSHAKINNQVALIGMHDHIRIWGKEELDKLNETFRNVDNGKKVLPEGWHGFSY